MRFCIVLLLFVGGYCYPQDALISPELKSEEQFGRSVCVLGDYLFVGGLSNKNGMNSGAVYVYKLTPNLGWLENGILVPPDNNKGDMFGAAISGFGNNILIGAYGADIGGKKDVGCAYHYELENGRWDYVQKITPLDKESYGLFSKDLAVHNQTAVIGCPGSRVNGLKSGSVYVFSFEGGVWVESEKLYSPKAKCNEEFGYAVALHGDVALVGAWGGGAAYQYSLSTGNWTPLIGFDTDANDRFGYDVATDGSLIVIGAPFHEMDGVSNTGAMYVWERNGEPGWDFAQKVTSETSTLQGMFGNAIVIEGRNIYTCSSNGKGFVVDVFAKEQGLWNGFEKLKYDFPMSNSTSPQTISVHKNKMAIGVYGASVNREENAGRVLVCGASLGESLDVSGELRQGAVGDAIAAEESFLIAKPNPVTDGVLEVGFENKNQGIEKVSLYGLDGKPIPFSADEGSDKWILRLHANVSGACYLKVTCNNKVFVKKIIIK